MKKQILETQEAVAFVQTMGEASRKKYEACLAVLEKNGMLNYPLAEKVDGSTGLFAIRIMTGDNERLFYCYDDGDFVIILCGYVKKTARIPKQELKKAMKIKRRYL